MPDTARSQGFLFGPFLRTAILLLLGGAVAFPLVRPPGAPSATAGGAAASGLQRPASPVAPDAEADAFTLLADFVGVDVSDPALAQDAARDAAPAVAATLSCVTVPDIHGALAALKQRPAVPPAERVVDALVATIRSWYGDDYCGKAAVTLQSAPAPGQSVDHYLRSSRNALRRQRIQSALEQQNVRAPEFIIATTPDPIDSNARWTFDGIAAAIQRAAAASDFVLDRFYIPDWSPSPSGDSATRRTHERRPAVILFRDAKFGADPDRRRVLVVLLVFETPTGGIHRVALKDALETVGEWQPSGSCPSIGVLGPVYSGSIPSLAMTMAEFKKTHPCVAFEVVSGSATNDANKDTVEPANSNGKTTFRATVLPDNVVQREIIRFLLETDPRLARTRSLALLVEDNTAYGSALGGTSGPAVSGSAVDCAREPDDKQADCVLVHARKFPFPLHISRLRSVVRNRAAGAARNSTGFLTLSLEEPDTTTDQVPSLSPNSTSASVELVLANILDEIARQRITTVGLLATDTRDKLFLAEQIAERSASVRLFTIESDLFYAHPDYGPYVRGMIVASTYPLFSHTQPWTGAADRQLQFPTTNAQGVYNALIALLRSKRSISAQVSDPLDYRDPDGIAPRPPVWISVVGRNGIWPVKWYPSTSEAARAYMQPIATTPARTDDGGATYGSRPVNFAFFLLSLVVAGHVSTYSFRRRVGPPSRLWFGNDASNTGSRRRVPYVFVAFVALVIPYAYAAYVFLPFVLGPASGLERNALLLVAAVSIALLLWLIGCTVHLGWQSVAGIRARAKSWRAAVLMDPQYWLMVISIVSALVALVFGLVYLWSGFSVHRGHALYFERITHPINAVSPVLPLIVIVSAVYMWAIVHLRRLSAVSGQALRDSFRPFARLPLDGLKEATRNLQLFVDGAVQMLPRRFTLAALAAGVVAAAVAVTHPLASPEPVAFTYAFLGAWVLLQILLLVTFALVIYFWMLIRQILESFDGTPMLAAFARLPDHLIGDRLSPQHPRTADVRRLTRFANQLGEAMRDLLGRAEDKDAWCAQFALTGKQYGRLAKRLSQDPSSLALHGASWAETAQWRWLLVAARHLVDPVSSFWRTRVRESVLLSADFDAAVEGVKSDAQRWVLRAEEFLAMQALLLVRELLARLVTVCFYIIVGVLLMVAAAQSFPFEPRQELLRTAWVYVTSAVVLVIAIFVQMERNPVLSAYASTSPGRIRWDAAFWSKLLLYGGMPIATVFAAQFPQIGNTILEWLTPVQAALP